MPPADRPCGRTAGRREVQQLRVGGDEAPAPRRRCVSSTAPTTSSPSLEPDDLPRVAVAQVRRGSTRLTTPLRGAERERRASRRPAGQRERALARRPSDDELAPPARRRQVSARSRSAGSAGQVERPPAARPARAGDQRRPRRAPCVGHGGDDHVVLGPAAAGRRSGSASVVRASSPVEDSSTQHGSSATSSGTAAVVAGSRPTRAARCAAGCRRSSRPRPARRTPALRSSCVVVEDRGELVDRRARARRAPSPARSGRTSSAGAAACRGCRWPGPRTGRRPRSAGLGPAAASSLPRMSWMTSSMSRIAMSRPSTRCSRSCALLPAELAAPADDLEPVVEVDLEQLAEPERARLAVDQGDVVDAERVLHRREPVELLEHGLGVEAVLDLDDQPQAVVAVGEVVDVGDALQLLGLDQGLDLLDDPLGADDVRQFGDDDALAPRGDVLDPGGGPDAEAAAAGLRTRRGCRRARRSCRRSAGRGRGRTA